MVDAIVVGQAFHWFELSTALDEMASDAPRGCAVPTGLHDDESDPLFREIQDALGRAGRPNGGSTQRAAHVDGGRSGGDADPKAVHAQRRAADGQQPRGSTMPPFTGHSFFGDPRLTEFGWNRTQHIDDLDPPSRTERSSSRCSANCGNRHVADLMGPTAAGVLSAAQWRPLQEQHAARVDALTEGHRARTATGRPHPVEDFLFTYYSLRPRQLRRWYPGFGVGLADAADRVGSRFHRTLDGGTVVVDQQYATNQVPENRYHQAGRP